MIAKIFFLEVNCEFYMALFKLKKQYLHVRAGRYLITLLSPELSPYQQSKNVAFDIRV